MATARASRTAGRPGSRARTAGGVAVLSALTVLGLGVPAGAVPAHPDPAAVPSSGVVLIVHAAGDTAAVRATVAGVRATSGRSAIGVRHSFPSDHAFSVEVPAARRAAAEAALRATPGVTGIETPVRRSLSAAPPNDPGWASESRYLSAVNAPQAWAVTHGSRAVRIAVVDTGIDVRHPDLAGKVVGAYDADTGGSVITDEVGHGTFVAGVAAADTGNGVGIAGAGYDTGLLGVKISRPDGELSIDDEIAGINWAVAHRADIINLSLGGTDPSTAEKAAIENAIAHGVLVVAAAGNDGNSVKQYPAAYPGVVAVGAVDTSTGRRASFSSYGPWVTLAAPGVGISSTSPVHGSSFFPTTSGYARADGTSFSTPLVAGEAALLKAADPTIDVAHLRQALVASAHGAAGQQLGAGQVDFAGALAHLQPTSAPTSATVDGTADRVTLAAVASSAAVEFRIDAGAWTAPIAVAAGTARAGFDTWGLGNGAHTLHARACSRFGECGTDETTAAFTLANSAPGILTPAEGATSTGEFVLTAEHPSGGGAELRLDGRAAGFDPSSPYSFPVNASRLTDGDHTVQVVSCSVSGASCDGPAGPIRTITTRSLHPVITALTHPVISPNGDHSGDTAALHFTLPDTETATVLAIDARGDVLRTAGLGTLARGAHVWTWQGFDDRGSRLPDGRYTIALSTTSPAGTAPSSAVDARTVDTRTGGAPTGLAGYAATTGGVDTVAPRLSGLTGAGATFYPVRDGYRDTFAPGVTVGEAGSLTLTFSNGRGAVVRTLTAARAAGRAASVWNGRDGRGRLVPAGRYRWQYSIQDAAGNRTTAAAEPVVVSAEKLVARTAYLRQRASSYRSVGGTDACATARKGGSAFAHGVRLRNACSPDTGDFAYAAYRFTVPAAIRCSRMSFQVYGRSTHRPSQLSVAVDRVDGGIEIPAYVKVSRAGSRWYSIASVPAAGHIDGHRATSASVLLTGTYRGTNDFDLRYARLRVSYTALG